MLHLFELKVIFLNRITGALTIHTELDLKNIRAERQAKLRQHRSVQNSFEQKCRIIVFGVCNDCYNVYSPWCPTRITSSFHLKPLLWASSQRTPGVVEGISSANVFQCQTITIQPNHVIKGRTPGCSSRTGGYWRVFTASAPSL